MFTVCEHCVADELMLVDISDVTFSVLRIPYEASPQVLSLELWQCSPAIKDELHCTCLAFCVLLGGVSSRTEAPIVEYLVCHFPYLGQGRFSVCQVSFWLSFTCLCVVVMITLC